MHLIIDGYGSDPRLMQNEEFIYQLLDSYPSHIGMTKISPPTVFRYAGSKPEDWGIWIPDIYIRSCCDNCTCSEDLV